MTPRQAALRANAVSRLNVRIHDLNAKIDALVAKAERDFDRAAGLADMLTDWWSRASETEREEYLWKLGNAAAAPTVQAVRGGGR